MSNIKVYKKAERPAWDPLTGLNVMKSDKPEAIATNDTSDRKLNQTVDKVVTRVVLIAVLGFVAISGLGSLQYQLKGGDQAESIRALEQLGK